MILHVDNLRLLCEHDSILQNISFAAAEGDRIVINTRVLLLGTCLLHALNGTMPNATGRVEFLGHNLVGLAPSRELYRLREHMGLVYRDGGLISLLNVADNVALPLAYHYNLGRKELAQRVDQVAAILNINELLTRIPDELNSAQTRLVNLARALVSRPRLLLVDAILEGIPVEYKQVIIDAVGTYQAQDRFALVMTTRHHLLTDMASAAYELTDAGLQRSS